MTARLTRRLLLAGSAALLTTGAAAQVAALPNGVDAALKAGGLVVFVRHGATTWSGVDDISWPRERQRLLSPEGEGQARAMGAAFEARGWPVGEVRASPFARTTDMARLAFGRAEIDPELLGLISDTADRDGRSLYAQSLARQAVPAGQNLVLVTHSSNITAATGQTVPEGGAVVLRPARDKPEVLAVIAPGDWTLLASK